MKVLVIPIDMPLPARSGGRIDVWRRIEGLHRSGAEVALLCWYDAKREGHPSPATCQQLEQAVSQHMFIPIRRSPMELLKRLINVWRWPSHVASRWVTLPKAEVLAWARQFKPDLVLQDGLYGAVPARWLAESLGVPLVYRSHNIEHLYMSRLQAVAPNLKGKLGLGANLLGLKRFEFATLRRARCVLDISTDDLAWWRAQGMHNIQWLPTSVDAAFAERLAAPRAKDIDVLYFGNLHTPNNIEAIRWLLSQVLPNLSPSVRWVIAGSNPAPEVEALCQQLPQVQVIANPEDMTAVIGRAKVIVNPMRNGSGVNLKSVEMLFSDAHLVSSSTGVLGLHPEAKACFAVTDEAGPFAQAVAAGLAAPTPDQEARRLARVVFDPNQAHKMLDQALFRQHDAPATP